MHPTTKTTLSDCISILTEIDEKLVHMTFMPEQELICVAITGIMMLNEIFANTDQLMFSEDEVEYLIGMRERLDEAHTVLQGYSEMHSDDPTTDDDD